MSNLFTHQSNYYAQRNMNTREVHMNTQPEGTVKADPCVTSASDEDLCPDYCAVINNACDAGKNCPEGCIIEETRRQRQEELDKVYKGFSPNIDVAMQNFELDYPEYKVVMRIDYTARALIFRMQKGDYRTEKFLGFEYLTMLRVPMDLYNALKNMKYLIDKEAK